jgi:predicted metal-dependent phosphoesterase TrpH
VIIKRGIVNGNMIDLHTHTNISDGKLSPKDLIDRASTYGLTAISICDHDTVNAYAGDLVAYAKNKGIRLILGIEFSTETENKRKYHIVGLFINYKDVNLLEIIKKLQENRRDYVLKAIEVLKNEGFYVDMEYFVSMEKTITKAHIARSVVQNLENKESFAKEFGKMPTEGEFIETYLLRGQKCFVEHTKWFTPKMAIDTIHKAGGLAFLAHPAFYIMKGEKLEEFGGVFQEWGIDGLESYNIQYDKSKGDVEVDLTKECMTYCEKYNLLQSGGSDFHTDNKSEIGNFIDLGFRNHKLKVPNELLDKMEEKINLVK